MIAIIDYDAGNIKSVEKAIQYLGEEVVITRDRDILLSSDKIILPGVGAFGDAMDKIRTYNLERTIYDIVELGKPFLGICLGLQLLFETSEESKGTTGLGILKGDILKIPETKGLKIPHMGWNSLDIKPNTALYQGIEQQAYVYFVHSYYLKAKNEEEVAATTEYAVQIHASVQKDQVYGCQFHPEKSSAIGLKILDNFIHLKEVI